MNTYFNVRYEFNRKCIHNQIDCQLQSAIPGYICVADGVVLSMANRIPEYLKVVNDSMFSICDSSYVPLYIRWIYGKHYKQYCGSQIFMDIIRSRKYRMIFMGTSRNTLKGLRTNLMKENPDVANMQFVELPYKDVYDFDYESIGKMIKTDGAEIIWVALGAPKQEIFMNCLKPYLSSGVMIAVGAAFKFYSGTEEKRAPQWMVKSHMEFLFRIMCAPKKQLKRCAYIATTLPGLFYREWKKHNQRSNQEK